MSTVHVLANPAAGRGHAATTLDTVVAALRRRSVDPVVLTATSRSDALHCLQRSVGEGAGRIVVVGGDGLIHLATQVIATTDVALGVVPVGTGNDFARAFARPGRALDVAVDEALSEPVALDAIRTSRGWVASVAGVGFSSAVNARANRLRHPRGPARYTVATALELPRLTALPVCITVDGVAHDTEITMAVVANTEYFGGGMAIVPHADPTDGRLDVLIVGAVSRATLLRFFPRVFRGTHVSHPAVTVLSGRTVRIELAGDARGERHGLWGDGEPLGPLPLELEVVPGALRFAGAPPRRRQSP